MNPAPVAIAMSELTDPAEIAAANARRASFERNWAWFEAHAADFYKTHRGKVLCISGEEAFVADTPEEALALAEAAHPGDEGRFTRYIPKERVERIYAHQRRMASL